MFTFFVGCGTSTTAPSTSDAGTPETDAAADSLSPTVDAGADGSSGDGAVADASVDGDASTGAGLGATCTADADCDSRLCLDISTVDDGLQGKYCTKACTSTAECSPLEQADCDPSPRGMVCLSGKWGKNGKM